MAKKKGKIKSRPRLETEEEQGSPVDEEQKMVDSEPEEENEADLSLCDASFSAADSVAVSGHCTVSRCTESAEQFLAAAVAHESRTSEFSWEENLPTLTGAEMEALWTSIAEYTETAAATMQMLGAVGGQTGAEAEQLVRSVAAVARVCLQLEAVQGEQCPAPLLAAATTLAQLLPSLTGRLANAICHMLESCWAAAVPGRESLALPALQALLIRTTAQGGGTKAEVRRVHSLQSAALQLEPGPATTSLLTGPAGTALYYTCPEGKAFLVFLFSISPGLVTALHEAARHVLPEFSRLAATGMGEVYSKAWLASEGEFRTKMEDCIQDLMYRCVVGERGGGGAHTPALRVLNVLHSAKRSQATQNLLARLYEPILWRHLRAASQTVRHNTLNLLLAAYPVENSEQEREERDGRLEQQHRALAALIRDESPAVRAAAVGGVCELLAAYWPLIPSDTINSLVAGMVKETVRDGAAPRVRTATLTGLGKLLQSCPESHVYLKVVLPKLSDCLHDSSEQVRSAMVKLLVAVQGVRSIKFWHVCPADAILARLQVDKPSICRKIVKLLLKSYFPPEKDDEVKLERLLHMVNTNPAASRKFYQFLTEQVDIQDCVKFLINLLASVKQWVRTKTVGAENEDRVEGGEENNENKENKENKENNKRRRLYSHSDTITEEPSASCSTSTLLENTTLNQGTTDQQSEKGELEGEEEHPYDDIRVVGAALDIACLMWTSCSEALSKPANEDIRSILEKKAGRWMSVLYKYFRPTPVISTVAYLASLLPERAVTHVASYCLAKVKETQGWETCVDCLCNWKQGDQLLELVCNWLRAGLGLDQVAGRAGKVRFEEPGNQAEQLQLAMRVLKYSLQHSVNRNILLRKNRPMLEEVLQVLEEVKRRVEAELGFTGGETGSSSKDSLAALVGLAVELSTLLHGKQGCLASLVNWLAWAEVELMPALAPDQDASIVRTRDQIPVSCAVLKVLTGRVASILSLGLQDYQFSSKCLNWLVGLLVPEGEVFIEDVMAILHCVMETAAENRREGEQWENLFSEKSLEHYAKLLNWLTQHGSRLVEVKDGLRMLKRGVAGILGLYNKHGQAVAGEEESSAWEDMAEVTVTAVVSLVRQRLEAVGELQRLTSVSELGEVAATLIQTLGREAGHQLDSFIAIPLQDVKAALDDLEDEDSAVLVSNLAGLAQLVAVMPIPSKGELLADIATQASQLSKQLLLEGGECADTRLLGEVQEFCQPED